MTTRLRELRKSLGLTQGQMAETLHTTKSYVSRLESGERELSPRMLDCLQHQYHASRDWLIHGTGDMLIEENQPSVGVEAVYQALLSLSDEQWRTLVEKIESEKKK